MTYAISVHFNSVDKERVAFIMQMLYRLQPDKVLSIANDGQSQNDIQTESPIAEQIFQSLKRRRLALKLSLRDVQTTTGLAASTISRIERGYECNRSSIYKLGRFYSIKESA